MSKAAFEIVRGDITRLEVDAIVNAANEGLLPGGGVCGAIHRAAGLDLAKACRVIGGCPTGGACITPGFDLPARFVIHAVGPVWQGGGAGEAKLLASCYEQAIALAAEAGLTSIAFPAISTGIYGYPADQAAEVAIDAARRGLAAHPEVTRVVFCLFDEGTERLYRSLLEGEVNPSD
jgi:O-acetyl-ADP-ribose deacetylase (regulator of RNase III)